MPDPENPPANSPADSPPPQSAQGVSEAQGQRALKALIGSGAAEFPMDVQMANMDSAGGEPPPPSPPPAPATTQAPPPAAPSDSEG